MNQAETLTREEPVTAELLAEMYRNVTMGSENLAAVVPHIRDRFLLKEVTYQLEKYADFTNRTASLLHKRAVKPKEPALMKVAMSRGGIAVNTLLDDSDGHVAEMIVKGTRTGLEQLEDKFAQLAARGADEDAVSLCREVIGFERKVIRDTEADTARLR